MGSTGSRQSQHRARGDVTREPALKQIVKELPANAKGKGGKSFRATIPVYFHVVHAGGVGNISKKVIAEQMRVLNAAFAGFYGAAASGLLLRARRSYEDRQRGMVFRRADHLGRARDETGPSSRRLERAEPVFHDRRRLPRLGVFPGAPGGQQYLDGIVVDWESMPGASSTYGGRFDLGHTATHEAGHWINLHHVFNGACNNWGDYVDDTPPQRFATNGCRIGQDSCSEPGLDSIHNYMDYSYDPCYNQFTAGQVDRMQDAWLFFRV